MKDGLADGDAQAHQVRVDVDEGEDGGEVLLVAWGDKCGEVWIMCGSGGMDCTLRPWLTSVFSPLLPPKPRASQYHYPGTLMLQRYPPPPHPTPPLPLPSYDSAHRASPLHVTRCPE